MTLTGRRWTVVAVASLAALLVSGAAGFLLIHSLGSGASADAPSSCGNAGNKCVAALSDATLRPVLDARGFICSRTSTSVGEDLSCKLHAGSTDYGLITGSLGPMGRGGLEQYDVDVSYDPNVGLLPQVVAFVSWSAGLPFPHDESSASAASSWATRQLRVLGNGNSTKVGGYQYRVDAVLPPASPAGTAIEPQASLHFQVQPVFSS